MEENKLFKFYRIFSYFCIEDITEKSINVHISRNFLKIFSNFP